LEGSEEKSSGLISGLIAEVFDDEASTFENLILIPLKFSGLFTVCYLANPFMNTLAKYFLLASSIVFTFHILELLDVSFWVLLIIGFSFGLFLLALELLKVSENV